MILPFSEKFPWGEPTLFERKLNAPIDDYDFTPPKIHTIRKDLSGRWRAGRSVQGYYNSRTKNMRKIFDGECKSVQPIRISYDPDYCEKKGSEPVVEVLIEGVTGPQPMFFWKTLNVIEIEQLAINDGFQDAQQFFKWFSEDFEGKIIHFTEFKY